MEADRRKQMRSQIRQNWSRDCGLGQHEGLGSGLERKVPWKPDSCTLRGILGMTAASSQELLLCRVVEIRPGCGGTTEESVGMCG